MARKVKRWAVREDKSRGGWYILFVGPKPRRPKTGWDISQPGFAGYQRPENFKRFAPKQCQLPFGGGAVEIRFADE